MTNEKEVGKDSAEPDQIVGELKQQLGLAKKLEESDYLESCIAYDKGLALAEKENDRLAQAEALEGMGRMLWKMADYPKAHQRYQQALDIFTELSEFYGMARCYGGLGIVSSIVEEQAVALEYFESAIAASRRARHDSFTAVLTANIGNVYFAIGRYDDAISCYEQALAYQEKHGNLGSVATMLTGLSGVLVYTGRYEEGLQLLQRALNINLELNRTEGIVSCMNNIGETLAKQGKHQKAVEQFEKALVYAEKVGYQFITHQIYEQLSKLHAQLDEPEKSEHYLQLLIEEEKHDKKWVVKQQNEKLLQYRKRNSAS